MGKFQPATSRRTLKVYFLSCVLALVYLVGCGKKAADNVKKGQLTDEVILHSPGYFILSNRNEFMAIGVKRGANWYMTLRLATSSDGRNWKDYDGGLKSVQGQQKISFKSERVDIFSRDEKQIVAMISPLDAPNTAIATLDGVDILTTNSLALIQLSRLKFHSMETNRVDDFIRGQIKNLH